MLILEFCFNVGDEIIKYFSLPCLLPAGDTAVKEQGLKNWRSLPNQYLVDIGNINSSVTSNTTSYLKNTFENLYIHAMNGLLKSGKEYLKKIRF